MNQSGNNEGRQVMWQWTPIHRMFSLNSLESGKDDSSLEAHIQSSKTSKGFYLDPALYIFVKMFEFYLWTSPFNKNK